MKNSDIRIAAKKHNIKLWEIADVLELTDSALSRKLRYELDDKTKSKIFSIIEDLAVKKEIENDADNL
jgi:hypothetical protein